MNREEIPRQRLSVKKRGFYLFYFGFFANKYLYYVERQINFYYNVSSPQEIKFSFYLEDNRMYCIVFLKSGDYHMISFQNY